MIQPATGRRRHWCSKACKQRAWRKRQQPPVQLTPELRRWLRTEIDRRRREEVARLERAERRIKRERAFEVAA